jgi:plastocyanin
MTNAALLTPPAFVGRTGRLLSTLLLITGAPGIGAAVVAAPAHAQEPAAVVEMTETLAFEPAQITVRAGDTVEWRNPSALPHTVTADPERVADPENVQLPEGAEPFDSGDIPPGETFRYTFEVPGQYRYVCPTRHRA